MEEALSTCIATGNLQPLSDLQEDISELDNAQTQVAAKVDKADRLRARGVDNPDRASAAKREITRKSQLSLRQMRPKKDDDDEERQTA